MSTEELSEEEYDRLLPVKESEDAEAEFLKESRDEELEFLKYAPRSLLIQRLRKYKEELRRRDERLRNLTLLWESSKEAMSKSISHFRRQTTHFKNRCKKIEETNKRKVVDLTQDTKKPRIKKD